MFRHNLLPQSSGSIKIGIIRGGQLGRMLIQACMNYDITSIIFDKDPQCPCRPYCQEFIEGDFLDYSKVYQFGRKADIILLEFENVNLEALETLEQEGKIIHPSPRIIRIIQDKGLQKQFYKDHCIPTADFILIDGKPDIAQHADFFPAVQKLRVSGYDGKGVKMIVSADDLSRAFDQSCVLEKKLILQKRSPSSSAAIFRER